jgi:hypothetical protein
MHEEFLIPLGTKAFWLLINSPNKQTCICNKSTSCKKGIQNYNRWNREVSIFATKAEKIIHPSNMLHNMHMQKWWKQQLKDRNVNVKNNTALHEITFMKEKLKKNFMCMFKATYFQNVVFYLHSTEMEKARFKPCQGYKYFSSVSRLTSGAHDTHRLSRTSFIDPICSLVWTDVATGKCCLLAAANCRK